MTEEDYINALKAHDLYIEPTLKWLVKREFNTRVDSYSARLLMLSIWMQESHCRYTVQRDSRGNPLNDLARGYGQFERMGGVWEVCNHRSLEWCRAAITEIGHEINTRELHRALGIDQTLCAIMTRGLLWIDPETPSNNRDDMYKYYLRRWRPGIERPDDWPKSWEIAKEVVG